MGREPYLPLPPLDAAGGGGCANCLVRHRALFSVLGPQDLEQAAGAVTHLQLAPGEPVYRHGTPAMAVFTLRSGIVRFERVTAGGDRRILGLAGPGALLGQEAVLQRPYADDAIACTPVALCGISRAAVDRFAQDNGLLARELMQRWQFALDASHHWAAELTAGTARSRMLKLLQVLLQLSPGGGQVWLPSRVEMSDMLDLAEETASRMVSRLRREQILQVDKPGTARVDGQKLQQALAALEA